MESADSPSRQDRRATSQLQAIGKYQLIASLGQGGMATVYLALVAGPAGFNKLFAVKVLREDLLDGSEDGVQMFWDEARLSAQLVHSNIVQTFEVGQADGHSFLAMEYLDGQSYRAVRARAAAHGGLPLHEELRILAETARGLQYLHDLKSHTGAPLGVVHRDVSPQNIFLTYEGQAKILDLGVAKASDAQHLTQVGVIKGKLEYIAPEQLKGEQLDGRADVFALGAMLWEAVTGQRFAGGRKVGDATRMHNRVSGNERKVRDLTPDAPAELVAIIEHATALHPNDRMSSAAAFAEALDSYLEVLGKKPNAKSLAAFLAPLFEVERKNIQQLIDGQIQRVKSGSGQVDPFSGALPRIGLSGTDSNSLSGVYLGGRDESSVSRSEISHYDAAPALPVRTNRRRRWLIAGIVAASVTSAALLALRTPPETTSPPVSTPPVIAAALPPAPPPSAPSVPPTESASIRTVQINIQAAPGDALVSLDGTPLSLPFAGEFQRSSALHQLEAVADGYKPFKRLISFDKQQDIEIKLSALAPTASRAATRSRPATDRRSSDAPPEARSEPAQAAVVPAVPSLAATPASNEKREPGAPMTARPKLVRGLDRSDPYATQ